MLMDFTLTAIKLGDPLLDISSSSSNCYCLLDRKNHHVILSIADTRFSPQKDETKMLWLRSYGVVSDALNHSFKYPSSVEEIEATITPPDRFSPSKEISITIETKLSRESVAWLSRTLWKFFESEEIPEEKRKLYRLSWKNYSDEEFQASPREFLKRPEVVSQS